MAAITNSTGTGPRGAPPWCARPRRSPPSPTTPSPPTVLEADRPVLVDFTAAWCPPCRVMKPVLAELAAERDDLRVVQLDVDADQRTAAEYGVLSMPTFILFRDGREVRASSARGRAPARGRASRGLSVAPRAGAGPSACSARRPATSSATEWTRRRAGRARRRRPAGPGASSHDDGTTRDAQPGVGEEAHRRRVGDLEQRDGAEAGRLAGGITVSRSAVPGSARMNGRPRRSSTVDAAARRRRRPGAQQRDAAARSASATAVTPARRRPGQRSRRRRPRRRRPRARRSRRPAPGAARSGGPDARGGRRRAPPAARRVERSSPRRARARASRPRGGRGPRAPAPPRRGSPRRAASSSSPAGVSSAPRGVRRSSVDAELGLQPAHLLRERRLREPELLGGAREVAVARDGDEVLEPPELHAQRAVQPASMINGAPVNAPPAGPSRKSTAAATSAGSISRLTRVRREDDLLEHLVLGHPVRASPGRRAAPRPAACARTRGRPPSP